MVIFSDTGFTKKDWFPTNLRLYKRGEWNVQMVVETVLSMLTYICDFKRSHHKVWDYFKSKVGYTMALFKKWIKFVNRIPSEALPVCSELLKLTLDQEAELFQLAGYQLPNHIFSQTNQADLTIPLQRPVRPQHFTGREVELAQLVAQLQPRQVVTICGPGGIGKTALATEAIWQISPDQTPPERFSDGLLYHSFYSHPQVDVALESIVQAFGEQPRPTPASAVQRVLAGRQALIFLDGTEEADNLSALLSLTGDCGVLITSRRRKDAVVKRLDLPPLPQQSAVKMLQAWGRTQIVNLDTVQQICQLVGGLPLAVRLVGRYLEETAETSVEFLEWLKESPVTALDQGEHQLESVRLLLERSVAQVSPTAQQLLIVMGLLAITPVPRKVLATAVQHPPHNPSPCLG